MVTQKLHTGDIIIATTGIPFIKHFGVVAVEGSTICVYHCTPERGVVMDMISEFLSVRTLVEVRRTGARSEDIYRRFHQLKKKRYDAISFNCIHFCECLTGK